MMLRYFNQNRDLIHAIERSRRKSEGLAEVFGELRRSRIWFVLSGDAEDRQSYEYLHYENRGTFVAPYASLWHARKSIVKN
jgi:uncharacterized protein YpmB